jgi:AraC-like DNA-binding protein
MRSFQIIPIAGFFLLTACNDARNPSNANFTAAINQYLSKHGETCTSIGRQFPIDVPAAAQQTQYGFGPQLTALQQAGLVSEADTTAVVHGMLEALRGPTPPEAVRRYQLTPEGTKYFRQIPGTSERTGSLCFGQKRVYSVLRWGQPVTIDGFSQTEVTYTYKFSNLAGWAERPDMQALASEMADQAPGSEVVATRLAEVLFIHVLRAHIASGPARNKGWLRAVFDPQMGTALSAIHDSVNTPWTVESLAEAAGMSRSAFAARFKELLGQTPLEYVTEWRMQKAMQLLEQRDKKLIDVARSVGYESDAAFSKAFKRVVGANPGEYLRRGFEDNGHA